MDIAADDNSVSAISTNTPSIGLDDDISVIHAARPQVPLDALPIELLSQIVRHLPVVEWPSMELLSRGLRNGTHAAWKSLTAIDIEKTLLPTYKQSFPDGAFKMVKLYEKLILRSPDMIDISGFPIRNTPAINLLLYSLCSFDKLRKIHLSERSFADYQFAHFLVNTSSRKSLDVINANKSIRSSLRPDAGVFYNVADGFRGVPGISVDAAIHPTMLDFELNVAKLPFDFMASIDSSRLTSFLVRGSVVPQKFLAEILRRSPKLEYVSFDISNYYDRTDTMHRLDIRSQALMLDVHKTILEAVERMEKLISLEVRMNFKCIGGCICQKFEREFNRLCSAFLANRPSFIAMSVGEQLAQPPFVRSIAPILPNLKKFKLLVNQVDRSTMRSMLRSQSSLIELSISSDSAAIGDMIGNKTSMQTLSIRFPQKVPTREELLELSSFENLRELRLRVKGENIDDSVLKTWASSFGPNLVKFEMEDCGESSSEAIVQFVAKCPKLEFLALQKSYINDEGLRQIASQSPKIKGLVLERCECVSIDGLQAIVDGMESLETLNCYGIKRELNRKWIWEMKIGKNRMIDFQSCNYWKDA